MHAAVLCPHIPGQVELPWGREEKGVMLILNGDSEFEVSIGPTDDGEWEGRIIEHHISRLVPTLHLRHSWVTLEAAVVGVTHRWQRLFPDEETPNFQEAVTETLSPTDAC